MITDIAEEGRPMGRSILSCGHEADDYCSGVPVEFDDSEGRIFAVYCHKCAVDLGAATERDVIVAWIREMCRLRRFPTECFDAANAIERGEHMEVNNATGE